MINVKCWYVAVNVVDVSTLVWPLQYHSLTAMDEPLGSSEHILGTSLA